MRTSASKLLCLHMHMPRTISVICYEMKLYNSTTTYKYGLITLERIHTFKYTRSRGFEKQ